MRMTVGTIERRGHLLLSTLCRAVPRSPMTEHAVLTGLDSVSPHRTMCTLRFPARVAAQGPRVRCPLNARLGC